MNKDTQSNVAVNFERNLSWINSRRALLDSAERGLLHEIAEKDILEAKTLNDCYKDLLSIFKADHLYTLFAEYLMEFRSIINNYSSQRTLKHTHAIFENDYYELPATARGRCAYFRNVYTDIAYSKFSQAALVDTASYHQTFASACEDVASGISEYCIMPIYSSLDGDISSFYKLADRYDLKITHQCRVQFNDDEPITDYALFARNILYNSDSAFEEISVDYPRKALVSELITALHILGAIPTKLVYTPTGYSSDYMRIKLVLNISSSAPELLAEYLDAVGLTYEILGIYNILA